MMKRAASFILFTLLAGMSLSIPLTKQEILLIQKSGLGNDLVKWIVSAKQADSVSTESLSSDSATSTPIPTFLDSLSTSSTTSKRSKRILTTNQLSGFRKNHPIMWPPGLGGDGALDRVIVDIGSNNGDTYTLPGVKAGHTVFAFEPSPMGNTLFRGVMRKNNVHIAFVKLRKQVLGMKKGGKIAHQITVPEGVKSNKPKVFLLPVALSNATRMVRFHESPCTNLEKCGKVNHIISPNEQKKSRVTVPAFRLDDFNLPLKGKKVWLLKIDVEGHELEVLQGAHHFLKQNEVPYVAVEFSNNGRTGTEWGVSLLEELDGLGYACYHLRGFGKCHEAHLKSPSLKCNYPFPTNDIREAPTFEEYTAVFAITPGQGKSRRRMADLMCNRHQKE